MSLKFQSGCTTQESDRIKTMLLANGSGKEPSPNPFLQENRSIRVEEEVGG
ncbi:MAG TPA: hypothetical protein V6D43_18595 [Candidatus Sericytochromatia bacterium]